MSRAWLFGRKATEVPDSSRTLDAQEIADLVFPIVAYAVETLKSVQRGDRLDMGVVQSECAAGSKQPPKLNGGRTSAATAIAISVFGTA